MPNPLYTYISNIQICMVCKYIVDNVFKQAVAHSFAYS